MCHASQINVIIYSYDCQMNVFHNTSINRWIFSGEFNESKPCKWTNKILDDPLVVFFIVHSNKISMRKDLEKPQAHAKYSTFKRRYAKTQLKHPKQNTYHQCPRELFLLHINIFPFWLDIANNKWDYAQKHIICSTRICKSLYLQFSSSDIYIYIDTYRERERGRQTD